MEVDAAAYRGHPDGGDTGVTIRARPAVSRRTKIC